MASGVGHSEVLVATNARRPPHGQASTSTQSTRHRSFAHAIRVPTGFTTPSPRLVRGPFGAAFSPSRPRSGDAPSAVETSDDALSVVVVVVRFFFLARGNTCDGAPPLATGPLGTTAARNGERGANTPDRRRRGNRGGGIKAETRAKAWSSGRFRRAAARRWQRGYTPQWRGCLQLLLLLR
jgi:hypothetical protein